MADVGDSSVGPNSSVADLGDFASTAASKVLLPDYASMTPLEYEEALKAKMDQEAAVAIADAVQSRDKDKLDSVQEAYGEAFMIPTYDELLIADWNTSSFPDSSMDDVDAKLEPQPPGQPYGFRTGPRTGGADFPAPPEPPPKQLRLPGRWRELQ